MPVTDEDAASSEMLPDADGRTFGWEPSSPSVQQDLQLRYAARPDHLFVLRRRVDLRPGGPPVYDQAPFNACTANAVAGMIHLFRLQGRMPDLGPPSRMHSYWHMRLNSGTQGSDAGGSVGEAIDAMARVGYCPETIWAYSNENLLRAPTTAVDAAARQHAIGTPWAPRGLDDIKEALGRNQPVAFGLRIHNSFFEADLNGGIVPMPDSATPSLKHAGLFVGYDDDAQRLIMRNSWGLRTASGRPCGDAGHYYLPYGYIGGTLSTDFWAIQGVTA